MRNPALAAASAKRRVARNRAFVAEVNARTVCAHCGARPIEWHNPEHVELNLPLKRICVLARSTASIATIQAELARCTPLCRRCHMREDGRLSEFMVQARRSKTQPPKPCQQCGQLAKPLRHGLCGLCADRARRASLTPEQRQRKLAADRRRYAQKREAVR